MIETMIRRPFLALVRCLALFVFAWIGIVMAALVVVAATLVLPYPFVARGICALATLRRRLARDWAGVQIDAEERPGPPVPQQREDGWYVHDKQLYKSPRFPRYLAEIEWLSKDPAFGRQWLWMSLTPFTGGLAVLVPPALVVAGALTAAGVLDLPGLAGAAGIAVGLAAALLGVVLALPAVRVEALWTKLLLQPGDRSWWHTSGLASWVRRRTQATWHGGGLVGLSFAAFGGLLVNLAALVVSWGGLIPFTTTISRPLVERYRRFARQWTGDALPSPYRPLPQPPVRDADGSYRVGRSLHSDREAAIRAQRYDWMLRDSATWRDLLWSATAPLFAVVGIIPAALVSVGFFGLVWQVVTWAPWAVPVGIASGTWVTPFYMWYAVRLLAPGLAVVPDWVSLPIGLAIAGIGLLLALPLLRLRVRFDRLLLNPTKAAQLAQRVEHLTESRADAVDAQAAELRRIERDLHDGAQARLISVGLSLAAIERLMQTDPDRARALVAQARDTSATALTELRDLVRGIHPPVLAERGLGDAVRAVALDTPIAVRVMVDMPGRVEAPVESAAYFAVCEALANAARHGQARAVDIDIRHRAGMLRVVVSDDGQGGADPAAGSGLRGVQRRLGTFDGVLTVSSPRGGPTVLTMEVPCALSSLKTSTS